MDPDVAWKELQAALTARNRIDVAICADNLIGWIERHGFLPRIDTWQKALSNVQLLHYLRDIRNVAESY